MHSVADIAMAIVFVALATTIVSHPASAGVITATGKAFSGSLSAAQGKVT